MHFVNSELRYANAHWPRENMESIVDKNSRLKVAYNIYRDDSWNQIKREPDECLNLVFSHGAQMCKELWNYIIEMCFSDPVLGPRLDKVVAIDAINHGDSYLVNKDNLSFTNMWTDMARDINCVIRELHMTGTTVLVGHSMGGAASMYAAFFEPMLVDSVIAIDPMGWSTDFEAEKASKALAQSFDTLLAAKARDHFDNDRDYEEYIRHQSLAATFHKRCQDDYLRASAVKNKSDGTLTFKTPQSQQLGVYLSGQFAFRDLPKTMASLYHEVLHVFGTLGNSKGAYNMREILRYGSREDIFGAGHLVPFEKPVETFNAMRPFLLKRYRKGMAMAKDLSQRESWTTQQKQNYIRTNIARQLQALHEGKRPLYAKI